MLVFSVKIAMTQAKPLFIVLIYITFCGLLFSFASCASRKTTKSAEHISNWNELTNPVLQLEDTLITQADAIYDQGVWYLFYAATYEDSTGKRSRIIEVSTTNFKDYSQPILSFNGQEDGWMGMANPHITRQRNIYYLTFSSWGSKPGQLFYMTSRDLKNWTAKTPLAPQLTANEQASYPSLAFSRGKWFLLYNTPTETRMAMSRGMRTEFEQLGIGRVSFYSSTDTIVPHARHQLIRFGNKWGLLASGNNFMPYLYILSTQGTSGLGWLTWEGGYPLKVMRREVASVRAPASASLVNMKRVGGYFYLFYVINPSGETTQERGSSKIEVYRSTDLLYWAPAGR
jgi:hypothetical protein